MVAPQEVFALDEMQQPVTHNGVAAGREEAAMNRFEQRKTQKMDEMSCGADKSKKGSFDAPIQDMLDHLNLHEDYVSTSSCSGRVAIFWEGTTPPVDPAVQSEWVIPGQDSASEVLWKNKKGGPGGQWLLCRHNTVTAEDVLEALSRAPKSPGIATLKHEPFILHVECRSLDAATRLMETARNGGYRESGISIGKKHVMVGVRTSALKIDAPVLEDGRIIVDTDYINVLVRLANEKFVKNQERCDKLYALLRRSVLSTIPPPHDATKTCDAPPTQPSLTSGHSPLGQGASPLATRGGHEGHLAVLCCASECEHVRALLVNAGMLNKKLRNCKQPDGRMAIPITAHAATLLTGSAASTDTAPESEFAPATLEVLELLKRMREGQVTMQPVRNFQAAGKAGGGTLSPYQRLVAALVTLLEGGNGAENGGGQGVGEEGRRSQLRSLVESEGGVPRKWEEYADLIVLPAGALQQPLWDKVPTAQLWSSVAGVSAVLSTLSALRAQALGVARVALKGEVDVGRMRQSHVTLVHPAGGDGWVKVSQNGLVYSFDVTRVMFSRGNVNERCRMGTIKALGETVLDLYAGIGYFAIPLLAQARVGLLYACEVNPDSVEALRRNLKANGVEDRCQVLPGDNAHTAVQLRGLVDRVNLGLLPSSELGWGLAVGALKEATGGWLHVHENVAEADEVAWLERLQHELCRLAKEGGKGEWKCSVRNVEHVKTFAPRVWHIVADVECRPVETVQ